MTILTAQLEPASVLSTVRSNWRIYGIDGALLGLFMVSACLS